MYALGYDIGSSSIKAALVATDTNQAINVVQYPAKEMPIASPQTGWAEQDPEVWWDNLKSATHLLLKDQPSKVVNAIGGIGIAYQMHGLVLLDREGKVLRPSIIWCDSRAVAIGDRAGASLGEGKCFDHLLNLPGNFTAAKFGWVYENEPEIYASVDKILLPGDYINYKLTGELNTTSSALSEGTLFDFRQNTPASFVYDTFGIKDEMIPEVVDTFGIHGHVLEEVAAELKIPSKIPVCYRAGDQPNNAMSLDVLESGEVAATGGTSGVVYGVTDQLVYDAASRVNSFAHVNHSSADPRIGVLLCINGAGSLYRWIRQNTDEHASYTQMESLASSVPAGAEGLLLMPFGNGAERMLNNQTVGASLLRIDLNRHQKPHIYRAALEGMAFSFVYGMNMMKTLGMDIHKIMVGNDNLFQSSIFSSTIASLMDCEIVLVETTGALGAAKATSYSLKKRESLKDAMSGNVNVGRVVPTKDLKQAIEGHYENWCHQLQRNFD